MDYPTCCEVCRKGPENGVSVFRHGKKGPGENPHWRCQQHSNIENLDQEVLQVVCIIEGVQHAKH
jgi:hypothetical protein